MLSRPVSSRQCVTSSSEDYSPLDSLLDFLLYNMACHNTGGNNPGISQICLSQKNIYGLARPTIEFIAMTDSAYYYCFTEEERQSLKHFFGRDVFEGSECRAFVKQCDLDSHGLYQIRSVCIVNVHAVMDCLSIATFCISI